MVQGPFAGSAERLSAEIVLKRTTCLRLAVEDWQINGHVLCLSTVFAAQSLPHFVQTGPFERSEVGWLTSEITLIRAT